MKDRLKHIPTTIAGIIILGGLAYTAFTKGFDITEALLGLVGMGMIYYKPKDK